LRKVVTTKGKTEWVSVCYPAIWVRGRAVSLETRDHYVTLAHGSQRAEGEEVPAAEACQARLLVAWRRKGLPVSSNTAKVLVDYIDGAIALMDQDEAEAAQTGRRPKWPTVALASSTGWLPDGSAFVRGFDGVHFAEGAASMDLRMGLLEGEQRDTVKAVVASGSVEGWRAAVEPVLRAHPRAAYAMAAAVVPPLLRIFAPVGSALCGSRELIAKALRWRKVLGGGLRQSGILAAAALHALDHHVERLADDHALAQRLALGLQGVPGLSVRSAQTNIVFVDVADGRGPALLEDLKAQGVLATGLIGLRFVTHLGVDAAGIDHAIACIQRFMASTSEKTSPASNRVGVY
jgi:hypothetical protein